MKYLPLLLLPLLMIGCATTGTSPSVVTLEPVEESFEYSEPYFLFSEVEEKPFLVRQMEPYFPKDLKKNEIGGKVVATFILDESGTPVELVEITATDKRFADNFKKVLFDIWRYNPGKVDGKPVKVMMIEGVIFYENGYVDWYDYDRSKQP